MASSRRPEKIMGVALVSLVDLTIVLRMRNAQVHSAECHFWWNCGNKYNYEGRGFMDSLAYHFASDPILVVNVTYLGLRTC